jgi:hypothetical protein
MKVQLAKLKAEQAKTGEKVEHKVRVYTFFLPASLRSWGGHGLSTRS